MAKKREIPGGDVTQRPLVMPDLSKEEQSLAVQAVTSVYSDAKNVAAKKAQAYAQRNHPTAQSTGRRYNEVSQQFPDNYTSSLTKMTNHRVASFVSGATATRKSEEIVDEQGKKHGPEHLAGTGFYFDNHAAVQDAVTPKISFDTALDAVGHLSAQVEPGPEKESLKGLTQAETSGTVHFSPHLVEALRSAGKAVPPEHEGKVVNFSDVPSDVAAHLTHPAVKEIAAQHVDNMSVEQIGKVHKQGNITKAIDALRDPEAAPDPHVNPKKDSYNEGHRISIPGSKEHDEYNERARMLGESLRQGHYQDSLDLWGLRGSNEGVLSNEAHTAEDSWMRSNSLKDVPEDIRKGAADVLTVGSKSVNGQTIGKGNAQITPAGIEHAVHHEATVRAAKKIQKMAGVDFTVPSIMVQETVWADSKRTTPKRTGAAARSDTDWNRYTEAVDKKNKQEAKAAAPKKSRKKAGPLPPKEDGMLF